MGRAPHERTEETARIVRVAADMGLPKARIAKLAGCPKSKLDDIYEAEMRIRLDRERVRVIQTLHDLAFNPKEGSVQERRQLDALKLYATMLGMLPKASTGEDDDDETRRAGDLAAKKATLLDRIRRQTKTEILDADAKVVDRPVSGGRDGRTADAEADPDRATG